MQNIYEILGWLGFFIYLLAYFLLGLKLIQAKFTYYLLNIIAAVLIIVISSIKGTAQTIVINTIWGLISFLAIVNCRIRISILNPVYFRIWHILILLAASCAFFIDFNTGIAMLAWCSVFYFLDSLLLFSNHRMKQVEFHVWNFMAAVTILLQLVQDKNWPVFALEAVWAVLAVCGTVREMKAIKK